MPSIFNVDPRSGVPIYLQLIEQITRAVAIGTLDPAQRLPTVKALALELTINPNTVARAYRELEREGIIETSPGRGSFVRADGGLERTRRAAGDIAETAIFEAVREAKALGLERTSVAPLLERALARVYGPGEQP